MTPLTSADIEAYADAHTTPLDPLLDELADATSRELGQTQMLAGSLQGRVLAFLVAMTRPQLALEIGTFSGYSALAMASALPQGGRLVTCEISTEHAELARRYFARSPHGDRIELRVGPALATVAELDGPFGFVFIDADKEGYVGYYEAVVPKLAPDGLILADNTLHGGGVLDPATGGDRAMAAFNDHVHADPRTENALLPIRDGLTLVRLAG